MRRRRGIVVAALLLAASGGDHRIWKLSGGYLALEWLCVARIGI